MPRFLRYTTVNGEFQCKYCDHRPFKARKSANEHWNVYHNTSFTPYKCDHCLSTFTRKDTYKQHDCSGKSYSTKPAPVPVEPINMIQINNVVQTQQVEVPNRVQEVNPNTAVKALSQRFHSGYSGTPIYHYFIIIMKMTPYSESAHHVDYKYAIRITITQSQTELQKIGGLRDFSKSHVSGYGLVFSVAIFNTNRRGTIRLQIVCRLQIYNHYLNRMILHRDTNYQWTQRFFKFLFAEKILRILKFHVD